MTLYKNIVEKIGIDFISKKFTSDDGYIYKRFHENYDEPVVFRLYVDNNCINIYDDNDTMLGSILFDNWEASWETFKSIYWVIIDDHFYI